MIERIIPGVTQAVVDDMMQRGIDLRPVIEAGAMRLMSDEETEAADMIVCGNPPANYPDDVLAWCADCGRPVVHRPHAPKKPVRVCLPCGRRRLAKAAP